MNDVLLSSSVTIAKYRQCEMNKDRERIAEFIRERFTERYIKPLRGDPAQKHGFCTMAICCLMIEALESFWQGWPDTHGRSRAAFKFFFQRCLEHGLALGMFSKLADDFYTGVRCSILHQAETTNGWRIQRKGPLFNLDTKTINATKFHNELEKALELYVDILKESSWDSEIWQRLRQKMNAVIKNCRPKATQ